MELIDFLRQTQNEVREEISERLGAPGTSYPFHESVFSEIVMQHLSEVGMTFDPEPCHFQAKIGNANLRLSGFSISDEADQIDLFVSLYSGVEELESVPDSETKAAAEQCLRFLSKCADGKLLSSMDESNDAYQLALNINQHYAELDQIRIYVLTDRVAKSKHFQVREISGKTVKLEVVDIERLHRHWSEGKPRDEVIVNFEEMSGGPLPCIWIPGDDQCDYALTAFPGEALRFIYEKYGARILEANVRSFLGAPKKTKNAGIGMTLKTRPEKFIAYNNGIVVVADEVGLRQTEDGGNGILWLKGLQIVNGGQTTATIYFIKKKDPDVDLSQVRVPAKVILIKNLGPIDEESLISDISRFANTQNAVKLSDLSANKKYHVELEKIANSTYCPDGVSRWFYERASGSYNTLMLRDGSTPAKRRQLRDAIPPARRITKTDLAKYLHAWAQKPHSVSRGSQKNFEEFMAPFNEADGTEAQPLPELVDFKRMIAQAIIYKKAQKAIDSEKANIPAFRANVIAYTVSLLSNLLGESFNLDRVWLAQDISPQLREQLKIWALEVNDVLHRTAMGRMISEWAKKPECWEAVREATYAAPMEGIPELG